MFTLCLTGELPTGAEYTNARLHKQRGWCRFEIAAASLIKHKNCLLDFSAYEGECKDDKMVYPLFTNEPTPNQCDESGGDFFGNKIQIGMRNN